MKKILLQSLCLLALLQLSCGPSLKVSTDYDKTVDFGKYKTFAMYKTEALLNESISQLNQQRIVTSIKNEMIKKGYQENTTTPDLLVNPVAIFKDRVSVSSTSSAYGYGGYYRPYAWGAGPAYGTTSYNVDHYKDGSLIIDVIDAHSKNLVWQGTGNKEIDKPAKDLDAAISKAVTSIMAGFPPGATKK
jgi:hypothetical protein